MKLQWILAVAALASAAGTVQARDVYWSVGVHAAPGVAVGVSNAPPVYVAPAPVYLAPPPVVYAYRPAPVYYAYQPAPVMYYAPAKPWKAKHKHHKHWRHHR